MQRVNGPDRLRGELAGSRIASHPDPSLPNVRQMLRERLRYFLTADGCDFDGLKLDHVVEVHPTHGLAYPPGSRRHTGIELLHEYQRLLYVEAKSLKPDCLIIGQSPNPYFSDCSDMVRVGPIYTPRQDSVVEEMAFRARMARIADPTWLIDTDGWPMPSLAAMMEYLPVQVRFGVPSLYYATHLDTTGEAITLDAYRAIRDVWSAYLDLGDHGRTG